MTEPEIAHVQPATDVEQMKRETLRVLYALRDAERREEHATEVAKSAGATAAQRRLELGRLLIEARKGWPARGPRAKGWGDYLADLGIEERTARRYMELAGYVEISDTSRDVSEISAAVPTYREAGIKPARAEPKSPEPVIQVEPQPAGKPWMAELEEQLVTIDRHVRAAFGAMEVVEAICEEHEASLSSPRLLTMRSMLTAVKTGAANALQLMEGSK